MYFLCFIVYFGVVIGEGLIVVLGLFVIVEGVVDQEGCLFCLGLVDVIVGIISIFVSLWQIGIWYISLDILCVISIVVRIGSSRLLLLVSFSEIIVEVSGVWVMLVRQVYMFSSMNVCGFMFGISIVRLWLRLVLIVSVGENRLLGMLVMYDVRFVSSFINLNLWFIIVCFCMRLCVCLQLVLNVFFLNVRVSSIIISL